MQLFPETLASSTVQIMQQPTFYHGFQSETWSTSRGITQVVSTWTDSLRQDQLLSSLASQIRGNWLCEDTLLIPFNQSNIKDTFQRLYQEITFDSLPLVEASNILRTWRNSYRDVASTLSSEEQKMAFWRSLVFDCIADEEAAMLGRIRWRQWQKGDAAVADTLDEWLQHPAIMNDQMQQVLYRVMREGQMASTATRCICVLPEDRARNGDSVALLCSLDVLAILRSMGGDTYQFVGVWYCDAT
jgi:hypothetical protein